MGFAARGLIATVFAGTLVASASAGAREPTWRVRSDVAAPLDTDNGWAAAAGETATVEADRPFRLRFESVGANEGGSLALEVRRNGGEWQPLEPHDSPYPTREYKVPAVAAPWRFLAGSAQSLRVLEDGGKAAFAVVGGSEGVVAAMPLPWPAGGDGSVSARLRLPAAGDAAAFVWGLEGSGLSYSALIDGEGNVAAARVTEDRQDILAAGRAAIKPGRWHEVEIAVEHGVLTIAVDDTDVLTAPIEAVRGLPGIAIAPGAQVEIAELTFEGEAKTPPVSIVTSAAFANGAATGDLLSGADMPFGTGLGVSLWDTAPVPSSPGTHTETEWPLVIRRTADGPSFNEDGDRFDFRIVHSATREPVGPVATVSLAVPGGHLGGTFVETPGRIGPFQAPNGDLYVIMEPAETDNKFMMMKSSDGGRSWREVDGANRPATGDLEAVDARLIGDRIAILHQVTRSARLHTFRTSDHPTQPDTWEVRDEVAARGDAIAQMATLTPRSDGSMVAVFLTNRLHYAVRSPEGTWSQARPTDPEDVVVNAGPQAVAAADDNVHLAYFTDDGRIWHRRLLPDGTLTARQLLAEGAGTGRPVYGAVLPLAHHPDDDSVTIAWRVADGSLWERQVSSAGTPSPARRIAIGPVVTDTVDSQQAGADLIALPGSDAIAVFIDEPTRSIFTARRRGSEWSTPAERIGKIEGSWVRGQLVTKPDGTQVLGIIYDAGSKGGTGLNRYAEVPIAAE